MTEPKWDEKELRLWAKNNIGFAIPKEIKVKVLKWADAGNYMLYAMGYIESYKERSEYLHRLAACVRRCGGYAFIRESPDSQFLNWTSLEVDMGGTIADKNKQAQRSLWDE